MKKLSIFLIAVLLLAGPGCKKEEKKEAPPPEKEYDETEVEIRKDGGSFKRKEGGSETEVDVSKDSAGVRVKRPK